MPHKVLELLTQPAKHSPWLLGTTLAVLALPPLLLAMKLRCDGLTAASRDVRTAAAGLFVAVPIFLWACMIFDKYNFVGDLRFYIPLVPLAVFVAYALALAERERESKTQRLARILSRGYLVGYMAMAAAGVALLLLPIEQGSGRRAKLMGTSEFHHWPSTKVEYEFSPVRTYVVALLKDEPDTILITNRENWFFADPTVDRSRVRRLWGLRSSYVKGPARLLIVADDPLGSPLQAFYWVTSGGKLEPTNYFEGLPDLRLITKFPEERIKILEARIPDGSRIALNRETTE
jgi:hypothetical protein